MLGLGRVIMGRSPGHLRITASILGIGTGGKSPKAKGPRGEQSVHVFGPGWGGRVVGEGVERWERR